MKTIYIVISFIICFFSTYAFAEEPKNIQDVARDIANVQTNLNYVWVLVSAALVFFMQAGFMCLESGMARAKNSINVAVKNLADFVIAVPLFWALGFGLMFGASKAGIFGSSEFFIDVERPDVILFFMFQVVFAGTAATIDSGAVAGRTKFFTYLMLSAITTAIVYPIFGHWAWGSLLLSDQQGWLEKLGFIDFAGSTVVHSVGGWMALVAIYIIGPRTGKFDENGNPVKLRPHNLTLVYLGTFILFLGWFGFNCGSTVTGDKSIAAIAFNTLLSAAMGGVAATVFSWLTSDERHPEPEMIANGVLAGLVGITAGCASVGAWGAFAIGLSSGVIVVLSCLFVERVLKLDDVVGAVSVHGVCGAWGTVAVAFFALESNLSGVSRMKQFGVQLIGVGAAFFLDGSRWRGHRLFST